MPFVKIINTKTMEFTIQLVDIGGEVAWEHGYKISINDNMDFKDEMIVQEILSTIEKLVEESNHPLIVFYPRIEHLLILSGDNPITRDLMNWFKISHDFETIILNMHELNELEKNKLYMIFKGMIMDWREIIKIHPTIFKVSTFDESTNIQYQRAEIVWMNFLMNVFLNNKYSTFKKTILMLLNIDTSVLQPVELLLEFSANCIMTFKSFLRRYPLNKWLSAKIYSFIKILLVLHENIPSSIEKKKIEEDIQQASTTFLPLLIYTGHHEQYMRLVSVLHKKFPTRAFVIYLLGIYHMEKGNSLEARNWIDLLPTSNPFWKEKKMLMLGELYWRQDKKDKAMKTFLKIIDEFPSKWTNYHVLAIKAMEQYRENPSKELKAFLLKMLKTASKLNPNEPQFYQDARDILFELGLNHVGIKILKKGLKKFPDDMFLLQSACISALTTGNLKEGKKIAKKLQKKGVEKSFIVLCKGLYYYIKARDLLAEKYLKLARKLYNDPLLIKEIDNLLKDLDSI